ncbi:hypothetical protein [Isoptericola haloaureus]|uniref:Septum formation-related domain-containing protein n=1 Tax=Isoptericola haloaureus TaxID=1542902 RepID=A0ABU7Z9R4_9MICO
MMEEAVIRRILVPLVVLTSLVTGCSGDDAPGVAGQADLAVDADVGSTGATVATGSYVNEATARYAACLGDLGIDVAPEVGEVDDQLDGYASIVDGTFVPDQDGLLTDDAESQPIGVKGENRDEEIRECYARSPGAKDVLIDMHDRTPAENSWTMPESQVEAGRQWAQCARDAGVAAVEDPADDGYVYITDDVSIEQAEILGEECTRPIAESEYWPNFQFLVADMIAYSEAIDGPIFESDRWAQNCEDDPDDC